jgi:hypothetical protein
MRKSCDETTIAKTATAAVSDRAIRAVSINDEYITGGAIENPHKVLPAGYGVK